MGTWAAKGSTAHISPLSAPDYTLEMFQPVKQWQHSHFNKFCFIDKLEAEVGARKAQFLVAMVRNL
jgi:hypothetical protein